MPKNIILARALDKQLCGRFPLVTEGSRCCSLEVLPQDQVLGTAYFLSYTDIINKDNAQEKYSTSKCKGKRV